MSNVSPLMRKYTPDADGGAADHTDPEPDVVAYTLQMVVAMAPGFSAALVRQIEERVRADLGGRRLYVPKRGKHLTPEQRDAVYRDGLTAKTDIEIAAEHGICKRSIANIMKESRGRFG